MNEQGRDEREKSSRILYFISTFSSLSLLHLSLPSIPSISSTSISSLPSLRLTKDASPATDQALLHLQECLSPSISRPLTPASGEEVRQSNFLRANRHARLWGCVRAGRLRVRLCGGMSVGVYTDLD